MRIRDEQRRQLRTCLTRPHRCRSGNHTRFGRNDQHHRRHHAEGRHDPARGLQPRGGPPGPGHADPRRRRARLQAHRGGPARHQACRAGRHPPQAQPRHQRGLRQRHGQRHGARRPGGPRLHRAEDRRVRGPRGARGRLHARQGGAHLRHPRGRPRGRGAHVRPCRASPHHLLPGRDGALQRHRRRHGALQHCHGLRQTGPRGMRREPHPRPKQRAGRLRHGCHAHRLHRLSEGRKPRGRRKVRGSMGHKAQPYPRTQGHRVLPRHDRGAPARPLHLRRGSRAHRP